jgi:hypothetical protein
MSTQPTPAPSMPQLPAIGVFAPQKGLVDFFIYPIVVASLVHTAGSNVAVVQQQISTDSDFYWNATTFQVDQGATPSITIQVNDQGSNRNLFNTPPPIATVAGTGQFPYRLVHPRLFTRGTTITVTFTNYSGAGAVDYTNLYVNLHGFKIYGTG